MRDIIDERLGQLKQEFEKGQQRLAELDQQRMQTQQTMLRIAGAIELAEELLSEDGSDATKLTPEVASLNR